MSELIFIHIRALVQNRSKANKHTVLEKKTHNILKLKIKKKKLQTDTQPNLICMDNACVEGEGNRKPTYVGPLPSTKA